MEAINNPHSPLWCQERASAACHRPGPIPASPHRHVPHPYVPMSPCPKSPCPLVPWPHAKAAFSRAKPSSWLLVHSELFQWEKHFSKGEDIPCPAVPARGDDAPQSQWGGCPTEVALSQTAGPSPSHHSHWVPSVRLLAGEPSLKMCRGSVSPCPHVPASHCIPMSFLTILFPGKWQLQTVLKGVCPVALHDGHHPWGTESGPAASPRSSPHPMGAQGGLSTSRDQPAPRHLLGDALPRPAGCWLCSARDAPGCNIHPVKGQ